MLLARLCAFISILSVAAAVGIQLPSGSSLDDVVSQLCSQLVEDFTVQFGSRGTRIFYYRNRNKYTLTYYRKTAYLKIDGIHDLLLVEGRELARLLGGTLFEKKGDEKGDSCGMSLGQSSSSARCVQLPSSALISRSPSSSALPTRMPHTELARETTPLGASFQDSGIAGSSTRGGR
jgi:hypothetical protein